MLNLTPDEIAALTSAFADDQAHFGTWDTQDLSAAVQAGGELATPQLDDLDGAVNRQMERMDEEVIRYDRTAYQALDSIYSKVQDELNRLWLRRNAEAAWA